MGGTKVGYDRRRAEGFFEKFIQGQGIDIGHGGDPLTADCELWDTEQGDATYMEGMVGRRTFDWVYSSHCLEHLVEPSIALANWWRLVKPGGHLIIAVPDFLLYEHGHWPSKLNHDHKTHWDVVALQVALEKLPQGEIVYCRLVDTNYNYQDETIEDHSGNAEVIVEGVVRRQIYALSA